MSEVDDLIFKQQLMSYILASYGVNTQILKVLYELHDTLPDKDKERIYKLFHQLVMAPSRINPHP